ncbi:MAG: hypothetical protein AAGB24_05580 [Bacteroidota bacterium]
MFRTLRHRLLFWFLVFIGFSLVAIVLTIVYLDKREAILHKREAIEQAYVGLLKTVESQQYFFSYETKNQNFFETGKSVYLKRYEVQFDSMLLLLNAIDLRSNAEWSNNVNELKREIGQIDSLFLYLTQKVKERGFKDYSLEGAMRNHAHWLEAIDGIPARDVLSLRRHEKDYIIRNEPEYVDKLIRLAHTLQARFAGNFYLDKKLKDSVQYHLNAYVTKFRHMVALDKLIGIKDNTGLKQQLDAKILASETSFSSLVYQTRQWARSEFRKLTIIFMAIGLSLLAFSVFLSAFIAKRITKPLTELTAHITRFVDSNFTLETEYPVV